MLKFLFISLLFATSLATSAQELNARVTVVAKQVTNNVNRNAFNTLQTALYNFINNRKWSKDAYGPNERIECSFFLNLESTEEANVYRGSLTIQAARPVYNSSYISPIINFKDDDILFKYVEFQQLEFNENRVTGSDGLISNLTALFAYYANMIIGFDNASFGIRGGEPAFLRAQNIVNNAPDGRGIIGWKAFDSQRNRYWLIDNILNTRYAIIHDVYYNYYRLGMDRYYEDETGARAELLNAISQMSLFNSENPNTMINQFFFQGKSNELIRIFTKALPQDKVRASEMLARLDITNASSYKELLK